MTFFVTLVNGLSLGSVYALIALGYTMVYGIAKMLNFAHGDIIMVGGYSILVFFSMTGNPLIAAGVAIVICCFMGVIMEKLAYKPLRGASPLAVLITAIGVSYLLQSVAQIVFGTDHKMMDLSQALGIASKGITIGSVTLSLSTIISLAVSVAIMVGLSVFIKYSKIGRAMIAVSEDRKAARLMGVNVNRIITYTFAIGSILAAVASTFYLLRYPAIYNTMGAMPGIKAFTAAVIGGIGSIPGAMIGGILLGVIECFCGLNTTVANYTDAIEFGILIILLLVRPNGLLGKVRREKV